MNVILQNTQIMLGAYNIILIKYIKYIIYYYSFWNFNFSNRYNYQSK